MKRLPQETDRDKAVAAMGVSRETLSRLDALAAALGRWQRIKNLVAPATVEQVWSRHILDSWQLLKHAPTQGPWLDLGSGGGFPGLVVAIGRTETGDGQTILVESNGRKCAFLRQMIHDLGLNAEVIEDRIEAALSGWSRPVRTVSARALAPLDTLLGWTHTLLRNGAVGIFPKGQDVERELAVASTSWRFDAKVHPSISDRSGRVLVVTMAPDQEVS